MFTQGTDDASAVIFSLEGPELSDDERRLFAASNPFGFILFGRNCEAPEQIRTLTDSLKETVNRDCPILIDQEGGRVQRLKPPIWRGYPAMQTFGATAEYDTDKALDSLRFTIMQLAEELRECGINVDCAPVLDVLMPETHDIIGDRSFSEDPDIVGRLGVSVCRNLLAGHITPIIKHLPGHGRATSDSHLDLPRVSASLEDLQTDFAPFKTVAACDVAPAVWGMMAHILYEAIDPDLPSSISPTVVNDIVRAEIGFDGILMGDDLDMEALNGYGSIAERAVKTIEAGCDLALHCSGKLADMQKIAETVPKLSEKSLERLQKAADLSKLAA